MLRLRLLSAVIIALCFVAAGCGSSESSSSGASNKQSAATRAAAANALIALRDALLNDQPSTACEHFAAQALPFIEQANYGSGIQHTCIDAIGSAIQAPGAFKTQIQNATLVRTVVTSSGADVYFSAAFLTPSGGPQSLWYAQMVDNTGIWQVANVCAGPGNRVLSSRGEGPCFIGGRVPSSPCNDQSLGCAATIIKCLQQRGYSLQKDVEPSNVPNTSANQSALEQLDYAHTAAGINSIPYGIEKPGVAAASISIYGAIAGAQAAAAPTPGATFKVQYSGNVAYVPWQGNPGPDIAACATTK